jgi:hypothetical protein
MQRLRRECANAADAAGRVLRGDARGLRSGRKSVVARPRDAKASFLNSPGGGGAR